MLVSGPAVGAAQILIWPYSCVFLPPMSTAIRTNVFFCGSSQCPFSFPGGSGDKSISLQCSRHEFDPWVGKIPWRRKWKPTPVLMAEKFHGWRTLVGYSPWGCKESDKTERFHFHFQCPFIYSIDNRICLVDHVNLIYSLYSWWEGFGSSSLATLPLGFNCRFIPTSACGSSTGVCS